MLSLIENALFLVGAVIYWLAPRPWKYAGTALLVAGAVLALLSFLRNLRRVKETKLAAATARRELERLRAETKQPVKE